MRLPTDRLTLETEVEETDTRYGFTWVAIGDKYRIRTPDNQFKEVPKVVVDTLRAKASEMSIGDLISETAEQDAGAANVLREMNEEGFVREDTPVERVRPPEDIRLWHRALTVALLFCIGGVLWTNALSTLAQPILDNPYQYLFGALPVAIPTVICSVVVHEFGHYYTAWKQGLDPEFGMSVINGVIPAVVTRTHGGWCLPRNRRMWNTLAGPAYGLVWTLGVFALYHTVFPHPGLALAGVLCFNLQMFAIIPLFHGDGYLLMTDFLDEQNIRTRGIEHLRNGRPTWQAAYAALSYGLVIVDFAVGLLLGYVFGDVGGAGIAAALTAAIYIESWLDLSDRVRAMFSASGE